MKLSDHKIRAYCLELLSLSPNRLIDHVTLLLQPLSAYRDHAGNCSTACAACHNRDFYLQLIKFLGEDE